MITTDTSKPKKNEALETSTQAVYQDIEAETEKVGQKKTAGSTSRHSTDFDFSFQLPKIKEIELLKEGVYAVDLEKTINDMLLVIKNMEAQLEGVLKINGTLERDLKDSKEIINSLKADKHKLSQKIAKMEDEIPSKRELQIEIDYQIEERNKAELQIRDLKQKISHIQESQSVHQQRSLNLEDQKQDYVVEINYLESRLYSAIEKLQQNEKDLNLLNGIKLAQEEKISFLEKEIEEHVEEKYHLINELKSARMAVNELHNALTESKNQLKMSFYKSDIKEPAKEPIDKQD